MSPRAFALALVALPVLTLAAAGHAGAPSSTRPSAPSSARVDDENFVAELRSDGAYKAGAEGSVLVTLAPKGEYHLNDKYPYRFKLGDAPAGVTFPKAIVTREDGKFEATKGELRVPFVAAKPGKYTIAGKFRLAVCRESNCAPTEVSLDLDVTVQ